MSKLFRSLIIFIVLDTLIFLNINVSADEALHEKYGYVEDFEYEDEFIAHALKSSVVYVALHFSGTINYKPVVADMSAVDDEGYIYSIEDIMAYDRETEYEFSTFVGHGSGVVISEDGYIATNSHVASGITEDDENEIMNYYFSMICDEEWEKFCENTDAELTEYDYELFVSAMAEEAYAANSEVKIFVCFPSESGKTTIDESRSFEAKVVEEGTAIDMGEDGVTQDGAILKINQKNLVSLKLSDSYPETNSKIVTAGFPGASEDIFQSMGSDESILSVTVGTGNIARLIPISGQDYKALEITTTISQGNSGGPSVDRNLNIEGLNTYGNSEDMRFAYMIPAEYIRDLSKDINLIRDDTTLTFLTGLQMLQQDYGKAALDCFEYVQEKRGTTPYIENLIELAKKASDTYPDGAEPADYKKGNTSDKPNNSSDDKMLKETSSKSNSAVYILIGGVALSAIIITIGIILIIKDKKKKLCRVPRRISKRPTMSSK